MARMYLSDFDNLRPQEPQAPQTEDNFLDSVTSGFKSGAAGVVGGITNLLSENPVSDWFDEVEKANQRKRNFDTIFSLDYLTSPSGAAYDVANQLGSMAALAPAAYFAPEGAVAGILGKVGSKLLPLFGSTMGKWGASQMAKYAMGESSALANAIRWGFTSIPESLSEAGQTNKEARDAGYDDNYTRAAKTFAANMAVLPLSNTLEGALLGGALFRPSAAVGESLAKRAAMAPVRMAPSVIAEGIQNGSEEAAQQMAQNFAMDRPLMEGVREAAEVGAFGSMVLGGLGGGARAMTVNNDNEESGRSYNQVDEGLQKSFDLYGGQRMPNGENGCVEAVVRLGQTYSKFLHDEFENGTARVGTLVEHAQNDNIPVVPFSEAALQKGDVIVYFQPEDSTDNVDDGEHVVIYDGQGGYVGNSSSQQKIVQNEDYTSMSGLVPKLIIKTGGQSTGASISSNTSQDTAPALPSNFDANAFISSARDFVESHYEDDTPDTLASRTDYFRNMFEDAENGKMPTQEQMQEAVSAYPRLGEMLQQEEAPSIPQQQEAPKENREAPATPDITIKTDNISRARETQTQNAADNFTPTTPAEVQAPVTQGAAVPQAPVAHGMTALTGPQSAGQEAARQRNEEATARQEGLAQAQAVQQQNALVAEGNQFADAARQIGFPIQPETEASLRRGDPAAINMARQLVSTMQNGGIQNANQLPTQNISSAPAQSGEAGVNQNPNAEPQTSEAEPQQAQIIDEPIPGYPPKMTYRRHAEAAAKNGGLIKTEDGQNILRAEEAGNVVDIPVPQEVADYYEKLKSEKKSAKKTKPAAQEKAQQEKKAERKETIAEEKKVAQNGSEEAREKNASEKKENKGREKSVQNAEEKKNDREKMSAAERFIDKAFPPKGSHNAAIRNEVAQLAAIVNPNNWVDGLKVLRADYKKQIDKILQPAIEALQKGFGNKVDIIPLNDGSSRGMRVSNNARWYQEFFAEHKRQPNKGELREMARQLVLGDANAPQVEGWTATSKDVADKIKEDGKRLVDLEQHLKACDAIKPKLAEAQKAFKAQQRVASKPQTLKQRLTSAINRFLQSAWVGSGAIFDVFDSAFIGTGEGMQAHGYGLYAALGRDVAEGYRDKLSRKQHSFTVNGKAVSPFGFMDEIDWYDGAEPIDGPERLALYALWKTSEYGQKSPNVQKAISLLQKEKGNIDGVGYVKQNIEDGFDVAIELLSKGDVGYEVNQTGALYHVEIPDNDVLLDEQKTFEEQPEKVQKALTALFDDVAGKNREKLVAEIKEKYGEESADLMGMKLYTKNYLRQMSGRDIYSVISSKIAGGDKAASDLLNKYGIEGITYDGRQDGRCYVIFNDKAISILERLEQEANQQGKGEYDIVKRLISIFKSADASTVPHELSHWFTTEQEEIAAVVPNSKLAKNLKALYDWADWKEGDAKAFKGSATEEEFAEYEKNILGAQKAGDEKAELYWKGVWRQEKIARAFEDYLKKGQAPTKGLKGIFARFKHWLAQIYRDLVGADIEPSKEVKQFFDSVLATEDELRTGEDMIMTPGEQEAYDTMKAKLSEDGKLSEEDKLAAALAARIAYRMSLAWRAAGEEKSAVSLLPDVVRKEASTESNKQSDRKVYHQFAGEKAKTADKSALARAQGLSWTNKTPIEIYRETGWIRGKDGKWRFEIPDFIERINLAGFKDKVSAKLEDIYDNPALYMAYPFLRRVKVSALETLGRNWGEADGQRININKKKMFEKGQALEAKKTLIHEIQHLIQAREGFARGGDPTGIKKRLKKLIKSDETVAKMDKYEMYEHLAGEQEAREVEQRAVERDRAMRQANTKLRNATALLKAAEKRGDKAGMRAAQDAIGKAQLEQIAISNNFSRNNTPFLSQRNSIVVFEDADRAIVSKKSDKDMASPIKREERPTEIQVPEEYNNNRNIKELYSALNDERIWDRIKDDMTPGDVFNALTTQHRSDIAKLDSYLDRLGKSDAPPQQIETTRNLLETALRNLIEKGEVFNGEYFRRALVRFARSTDGRRKGSRLAESFGNGRLETLGRRYKLPNGQRIMSLPHEAEFKSERINSILEKIEAEGRPERGGHFIGRNSLDTEALNRSKEELRNEIVEAFPGAKVKDNGDHLTLTMPNGTEIAVDLVDKIVTSEDELARAKEEHGLDQGTEAMVGGTARALDNKAFVELAKTSHKGTGFHEAFHLAYDMVLNDKENAAIKKAYEREGKGGKSFDEWTADEYARWKQERLAGRGTSLGKLWQKITDFARKMKALFAGDTMQDVFRKVEQGEVWKREAQKGTGEVHHSVERANKLDQDNVNKAAKNAASRIEVRENKKKGAMSLGDRYLWSPSRIAKRHPEFKPFFDFADKAMKKLTKLREEWGAALSSALDMAKDKEGRETLYDILWQGDAEGKEYSDAELREMGANDDVIKAYKSIRSLMGTVYDALNDARRRPQVKTRTMSESSLEDLKNNKFVIKILSDEKQSDGKHKVTWREYQNWERDAVVDKETYDKFKKDPAIQILSEEKLGDNSYALHYRESIAPLTNRKGYIPHFFHDFRVILSSAEEQKMIAKRNELYKKLDKTEGQKEKNAIRKEIDELTDKIDAAREENTDSILGSFRTLGDAMDYAKKHEKELPEGAKLIISPKTFNFKALGQDGKMLAAVLGDKDYDKVMRSIAANTDLTVAEAREVIDARKKGRHRFNGNFLQRKGYSGFVKDMEWVLRHHINSSARYVAMETEFKPKAINLFERMYGDFDKQHEGIADYTRDYINDVNGVPSNLEKTISNTLNNWSWWRNHVVSNFGERAALQLAGNVSGAVSIAKLGMLNVSSAMINLTQLANAAAYIGDWNVLWNGLRRGAKGIYGKYSDKDQRVLDETGVAYDIGLDSGGGYDKFRPGKLAAKSMILFKTSEETVRRGTVLAAYDAGIKRGMSHEEAIRFAEEVNRKSNFEYGVQDAPNVFRRGSIISQLLLQFKKYPIKELEVMSDMLSQQTNAKQKAIFWGTYFMLAGLFQVPFGDWFEELAELIGLKPGPTLRKWMMTAAGDDPMKQTLAKMAMYGVGAGMNVDISQRYGLGGVLPTDLYLGKNPSSLDLVGSLGGATVSTVRDLYRLIGAAARLDSDAALASLRGISPGVANAVSAYNGKTYDKRGRVATEYNTPRDRILKALGFRSADEAAVSDIRSIYYDEKEEKTQEKQRAIDKYLNEPTTENAKRLKELGVKPATVKKARQQRKLDNLHRTEANMSKKERKEYQDLLKFTK